MLSLESTELPGGMALVIVGAAAGGNAQLAGSTRPEGSTRMPFGDFVNTIPPIGFLAVHLVLFGAGAYFAWRSYGARASMLGAGFGLFAVGELVYMTYHLDWTVFLFAHTIAEVLNLVAFSLIFVAAGRTLLDRAAGSARA